MGEIAEMMLDGTLCSGCGEYLEKKPEGFPDYCSSCRPLSPRGFFKTELQKKRRCRLDQNRLRGFGG